MKPSTKDKIKGSFHEVEGTNQGGSRQGYEGPGFESQRKSGKEGGRGSTADRECERSCR